MVKSDEEAIEQMATSNRDRISRGLDLFAEGMRDFVDQHMTAAAPGSVDWLELLAARDEQKHGSPKSLSKSDPAVQLRVLTEEWRVFRDVLAREHSQIAGLLRDERNKWAHNEKFSARQALNALDHMHQLLLAAGSVDQAAAVDKLWQDTNAAMAETNNRRVSRESDSAAAVSGEGLKPWREVVRPHDDITTGNFNAAEYAANLARVADGKAETEYGDPIEFFRRTFLTEGLKRLLATAARRLSGDVNAEPVFNLQTNFGGGKTHSMLALFHLASGTPLTEYPDDLQTLLAEVSLPTKPINRATFVGTDVAPGIVHTKPDGTHVHTIWGELAWQLAGPAGYALVAESDRTASNPGAQFRQVLEMASPCVILIDEWVAYGRQLLERDKKLVAGSFETQFTFAQSLTDDVARVPGAFLAVSLPESRQDGKEDGGLETGGALGRQTLDQLTNVVGRVVGQWHPASSQEAFEIVRRRLFQPRDAEALAQIELTANKFLQMYGKEDGFPTEAKQTAYRDKIKACYPIHPELFDRLYQSWSTLERFQRTRGVLRLMSTVIHALYNSEDNSPLIMPGFVPLADAAVIDELTNYLEDQWRVIVDTDVAGKESTPARIDAAKPVFGGRRMTSRLARTLFLGSAPTLRTPNKGIERQHILLGTAIPGDTVNNYTTALQQLAESATFLYGEHGRWYYNTQPSMTRTAKELASKLPVDDVHHEIVKRLQAKQPKQRGDFAAVYPAPTDPGEVRDREQTCLVICHPRFEHAPRASDSPALVFAKEAVLRHGGGQRENRNMLAFLAPDRTQLELLTDSVRSYLAWSQIVDNVATYDLTSGQHASAQNRKTEYNNTVDVQIDAAYIWVIAPEQPDHEGSVLWQPLKADSFESSLAVRAGKKLKNKGDLYVQTMPAIIHQYLTTALAKVWQKGHISVGELWGYFRTYYYLPRLSSRDVLEAAIEFAPSDAGWQQQGFALATGYDEATGKYLGLAFLGHGAFGAITDSTLLVRPSLALQQQAEEESALQALKPDGTQPSQAGDTAGTSGVASTGSAGGPPSPPAPNAKSHYFRGVYRIDSEQYARPLTMLQTEILPHLSGDGSSLRVTVTVEATNSDGFPEAKVRTVTENARQMKFVKAQFEQMELEFGEEE
ncbi:DUF499 domain-containing protein [Catenulispora pinisilvae]|uniref:DUF499 domain-containing protein n=1 Tax=Catenulispora pinisilvae TaxID=2705253 RepID=UPI001891035E|nr:DUF499 domain-containing protein [Catenulispora pinisilvae]